MDNLPPPPSRAPAPQLAIDELHQLRWLLGGVLTLLAVATVAYMDVDAWWLMLLTGAAALATTVWPTLPARLPRTVHLLAFPVIAAFFALDLWLKAELLPAMVRLDMLLLLYRALMYRQRREDLQVIVLGLFLVVVAGVLTVSLMFAVQILAYTACALLFLFVLTLVESARLALPPSGDAAGASATDAARSAPAWALHAQWRRLGARVVGVLDWRVAVLSGALFIGVIAASAVLFLVIPRFQLENGMFLDRFITKKARTGFSDSIKFGDVTEIQQDTSVALHVDPSDPGQIPLAPYWRMLVLNEYANGTFRMSPALRLHQFGSHARTGVTVYGPTPPRRSRAVWKLYFEPGVSRYLPMLGPYRRLTFAEAQTFQVAERVGLLALTKDPVAMTAYQMEGIDLTARLNDPPLGFYSGVLTRSDSGAPAREGMTTLRALAAEAAGPGDMTTADFSARVCVWLRERHPYSLSPRIPEGVGDPLVRWAASTAPGHCELFAGSFVLLARVAGYPARVVTGFRGGTWNAYSNSFTVRNSDAHAWAEIYDRVSGTWLRADPLELPGAAQSSNASGAAALAQRTDRSWAARLDSLRVFWYRRVVSFDEQAQVQTLKVAKELAQSAIERFRTRVQAGATAFKTWWHRPWDVRRVGGMGLVLLGVALLTWGWRFLRLRVLQWSSRHGRGRRDDPIRREAGKWLQRVRRAPADSEAQGRVVAELERLRFGARDTWPDPPRVFRRARAAVRKGRRRSGPRLGS